MDQDLVNEVIWVMTNYGSNAGEQRVPGSKLRSQAERIAEFVRQREEAYRLLAAHGLNLVAIKSALAP
jgi:hypothetical protein